MGAAVGGIAQGAGSYYGAKELGKSTSGAYSDRMMQWDFDKFTECCEKNFEDRGQYFDDREPKLIEAFLKDYFADKTLKLVTIEQSCNHANGYPIWHFSWISTKERKIDV